MSIALRQIISLLLGEPEYFFLQKRSTKKCILVSMILITMVVLFTGHTVQARLVIDDWTTGQLPLFVGTNDEFNPPPKTDGKLRDGNMLGGERDLIADKLEQFLNTLEGTVVSIIPNVSIKAFWIHQVDFLLIVEKVD